MRNGVTLERSMGAARRGLALGCVLAFVLHVLWVPAHLAFEHHLHCGPEGHPALAHGVAHGSPPGADPTASEPGIRHQSEHEPHPAGDHAEDPLVIRSSVGKPALAPLAAGPNLSSPRLVVLGRAREHTAPAPGRRPADAHATRGPPTA